jgi:hypothetical protein
MLTKVCRSSTCHTREPQAITEFRVRHGHPHLRQSWCNSCKRTLDRERQRGLKLRDGISGPTKRRRFRPYQFVATELQRAYSSLARGDTRLMLSHISAATNAINRLLNK